MPSAESEDEPHSSPRKSMSPSLQATFGLTIDSLILFFSIFDQLESELFFISSLFSQEWASDFGSYCDFVYLSLFLPHLDFKILVTLPSMNY